MISGNLSISHLQDTLNQVHISSNQWLHKTRLHFSFASCLNLVLPLSACASPVRHGWHYRSAVQETNKQNNQPRCFRGIFYSCCCSLSQSTKLCTCTGCSILKITSPPNQKITLFTVLKDQQRFTISEDLKWQLTGMNQCGNWSDPLLPLPPNSKSWLRHCQCQA